MKYFDNVVCKIQFAESFADGNLLYKEIKDCVATKVNEMLNFSERSRENHNDECFEELKEMIICGQIAGDKIHDAMNNEIFEKERARQ